MIKFLKGFFTTLLILIILGIGFVGYFIFINKDQDSSKILEGLKGQNGSYSFLLLGVDSLDQKHAESTRSDVIMIGNLNFDQGKIHLISIPRDTRTIIAGRKRKEKINHSFAYGGSELTLKTVNNLLGTDIKNYITVDYSFIKGVVNSVGGVKVDIPIDMDYDDEWDKPPLHIHFKQGLQKLNGNDAIKFLRFRHGYKENDLDRVKAQRNFVKALANKIKSPRGVLGIPAIINTYKKHADTNMEFSEVVKLGLAARKLDLSDISSDTIEGSPKYIGKISYFLMNEEKTDDLLRTIGIK